MQDYRIENYGRKSTFASFLPGIAGIKGKPIWCYYVNRGQGVVSFGVDNKDHAIMEFWPAHVAYQNAKRTGFRTFLKVNGNFVEPFSDETVPHHMDVGMNVLGIEEQNEKSGITTKVTYYILPEESLGALIRRVELTNTSNAAAELEILDGMPALIPYGVGVDSVKNMTQLAKAWMQAEHLETGIPFYRVRASMGDTAAVTEVKGGNFSLAIDANGQKLSPIIDMEVIFGYDSSLEKPVNFKASSVKDLQKERQNTSNLFPGSFFAATETLAAGQSYVFYELIGQVESHEKLESFLGSHTLNAEFFAEKEKRARELTEELTNVIDTHTGSETFDAYSRYTYMDNVLRGGMPVRVGDRKVFYVYSRKHGDLEREYNYFSMSPEYYSQGNGNFRDVNQNRREDDFFSPFVGRKNIHTFYNLIQMDGYNPLSVERKTYRLPEGASLPESEKVRELAQNSFTPGQLLETLEDEGYGELFAQLMDAASEDVNASFGEGYWTDHWTYNLDLVEEYLRLFPEEERDLLLEKNYTYFQSKVRVLPRSRRYEKTANGIRQYHSLDHTAPKEAPALHVTLLEKLLLLCATKFSALDPFFMGIEMEGGKPGWYDALNGLPGLLGSSMAESYELARMLNFTIHALETYDLPVSVFAELHDLLGNLAETIGNNKAALTDEALTDHAPVWNAMNDIKEKYREQIYAGISGVLTAEDGKFLLDTLRLMREVVTAGIARAVRVGKGIAPTYFAYDVTSYTEDEQGIHPTAFAQQTVPDFLEGPVRYLKLDVPAEGKKALYDAVKASGLYDTKLSMYKVNASLDNASYEIGRCRCFTAGWLENESIWLHMEYKYLLELIKSGLYAEFAEDFHKAAIPFLDPEMYGRSILENSSFLASSANPNPAIHGKGFVARLSGSTVEFLSIWKRMMFGNQPFGYENGELCLNLQPVLPEYLIGEDLQVSARFMDRTDVIYHLSGKKDYLPGTYQVSKIVFTDKNGAKYEAEGGKASTGQALQLRDGAFVTADVYLN